MAIDYFTKSEPADGSVRSLVQQLGSVVDRSGGRAVPEDLAGVGISMESLNQVQSTELGTSLEKLETSLATILKDIGEKLGQESLIDPVSGKARKLFTTAQKRAAVGAGMIGSNPTAAINFVPQAPVATESMVVIGPGSVQDAMEGRIQRALESYDERDNRTTVVYSMAYNVRAARQDDFAEAFFPTVTIAPNQYGFSVSMNLISIMPELRRSINGETNRQMGKKNLIFAQIDPSLLSGNCTDAVPVYRDSSKHLFADPSFVKPTDVLVDGQAVTTAPLKVGVEIGDFLGLTQTEALLETGILDSTDALDTYAQLKAIYIRITDGTTVEALKYSSVSQMQSGLFVPAQQGNYRLMNLNFRTQALPVGKKTVLADGTPSKLLAPIVNGEYQVRLGVSLFGSFQLDAGELSTSGGQVKVVEILDNTGSPLDLTKGVGADLAKLFQGATIDSYDIDTRRTNSNRRQRGNLLDISYYSQMYAVPLRSPLSVPRPQMDGDQNDASDLQALINATRVATTNAAIDKLLETEANLAEWIQTNGGVQVRDPEVFGITRLILTPWFEHSELDVSKEINSIKSSERMADLRDTLVNMVREKAVRAYRDSGYKCAVEALSGGMAPVPTVLIGTDPYIANFLQVVGDFRTLGNDFNVKVVSTMNKRMRGKLIFVFADYSEGKEGQPNPLHFGNMAWRPELTLVLPTHRNGGNSKELTVQPSYLHVVHVPIMGSIDVKGLSKAAGLNVPVTIHAVQ